MYMLQYYIQNCNNDNHKLQSLNQDRFPVDVQDALLIDGPNDSFIEFTNVFLATFKDDKLN